MKDNKQLLHDIQQRYNIVRFFSTGGSSSGCLLASNKRTGHNRVIKFSNWNGIGSSGIPWLRAQATRIRELRALKEKRFAQLFPEVIEDCDSRNGYWYVMEYFPDSIPISLYYAASPSRGLDSLFENIESILKMLADLYSVDTIDTPTGFIESAHINRMENRLKQCIDSNGEVYKVTVKDKPIDIGSHHYEDLGELFRILISQDQLVINETIFPGYPQLLAEVRNGKIRELLLPPKLPKYFHGDSTLRNYLLLSDGDIRLIDVRGNVQGKATTTQIDIAYELAKILRTFYLEIIRGNNFNLTITDHQSGKLGFTYQFTKSTGVALFTEARRVFINRFENNAFEFSTFENDSHLVARILFAEAAHFIADAVNRLESDPTGKQSIAYFLTGIMIYDEFIAKL